MNEPFTFGQNLTLVRVAGVFRIWFENWSSQALLGCLRLGPFSKVSARVSPVLRVFAMTEIVPVSHFNTGGGIRPDKLCIPHDPRQDV